MINVIIALISYTLTYYYAAIIHAEESNPRRRSNRSARIYMVYGYISSFVFLLSFFDSYYVIRGGHYYSILIYYLYNGLIAELLTQIFAYMVSAAFWGFFVSLVASFVIKTNNKTMNKWMSREDQVD